MGGGIRFGASRHVVSFSCLTTTLSGEMERDSLIAVSCLHRTFDERLTGTLCSTVLHFSFKIDFVYAAIAQWLMSAPHVAECLLFPEYLGLQSQCAAPAAVHFTLNGLQCQRCFASSQQNWQP